MALCFGWFGILVFVVFVLIYRCFCLLSQSSYCFICLFFFSFWPSLPDRIAALAGDVWRANCCPVTFQDFTSDSSCSTIPPKRFNSNSKLYFWASIARSFIGLMTWNLHATSWMIFFFHSFIYSFSTLGFLVAISIMMIACGEFPVLLIARVFKVFVAFTLVALRTFRLSTLLVTDSTLTYGTICLLWLDTLCYCLLKISNSAPLDQ